MRMDLKGVECENVDWINLAKDFFHFELLNKHWAGKQLVADVKVTCRLQTLDTDFFYASL
jgi:hypothetical protein